MLLQGLCSSGDASTVSCEERALSTSMMCPSSKKRAAFLLDHEEDPNPQGCVVYRQIAVVRQSCSITTRVVGKPIIATGLYSRARNTNGVRILVPATMLTTVPGGAAKVGIEVRYCKHYGHGCRNRHAVIRGLEGCLKLLA